MQADPETAATADTLPKTNGRRGNRSSATWTTSSGDMGTIHSDVEELEDRSPFVDEYNRLAKKYGVRPIVQDKDCPVYQPNRRSISNQPQQRRSWFSRHFGRDTWTGARVSSSPVARPLRKLSSKRSLSELAAHFMQPKRDGFKDEDLQTLVRLCGQSKLYLPSDYAPAPLVLPTCLRATAQFLVQHGTDAKGIFRIPGSTKTIQAIYDYYCPSTQDEADKIDGTVSSPSLPPHLKASVHDVAGTFKRFLAGLPGGILGSLPLFDALVSIHSQLTPEPEVTRTKQSKLRARLLALAVGTLKSQYRRELVCAVFGLLCLIGRTAERAPREDEQGRPLPTSDLMGYRALGQAFGSLLVGDLLDSYDMQLAHPDSGLVLLPLSPTKRKLRRKSKASEEVSSAVPEVDKVSVANDIAEMLITHWREVVKHIKDLERRQNSKQMYMADQPQPTKILRPSASAPFGKGHPSAEWVETRPRSVNTDSAGSPMPRTLSSQEPLMFMGELKHVLSHSSEYGRHQTTEKSHPPLFVKRKRPSTGQLVPNMKLGGSASHTALSPPAEESPNAGSASQPISNRRHSGSASAERNTTHESQLRSPAVVISKKPTDGHNVIHSPVPLNSVRHSPLLDSAGRYQALAEASTPPVDIAADMAMREPRRSLPSPVNLTGMEHNGTQGSHRGRHIGQHGKHSRQATGVSDLGSDVGTVSPSESVRRTGLQSQPEVVRSVKDSTNPPALPQGLDRQSLGSSGPGDSNLAPLPPRTHTTGVLATQGTGRLISDHSLDSGYFPDDEPVPLLPYQTRPNAEAERDSEPETPTIVGAFPGPDPFSQTPSKRSTGQIDSRLGDEGSREAENRAMQSASSVAGVENRSHGGHGWEAPPIHGLSSPSEPKQVSGTNPAGHTSWSRRASSGNSTRERQPLDSTSPPDVKEVSGFEHVPGHATLDTTSVAEGKTQTPQEKPSSLGPLSGVKAMAALFENVWNNPASLTSQWIGPRKSRSMGNTNAQFTPTGTTSGRPMAGRSSSAVSKRVSELQQHLSTVGGEEDAQRGSSPTRDAQNDAAASQPNRRHNRASTISLTETPVAQPQLRLTHPSIPLPQEVQQAQQERLLLIPGRMTPGIEHPPIARHISQRRPPRSVSPSSRDNSPARASRNSPASVPLPGGTAALHAQVRHLQRQLAAKTEETIQLRHQIEALEGGNGVGTLSERLRNAERDAKMWRERALAAETRVAVFEKFLGRVRQLREKEKEKGKEMYGGSPGDVEQVLDGLESAVASHGGDGQVSHSSIYSADTEDEQAFRGRLRKRLVDRDGEHEELEEDVYDEDEEAKILDAMMKEEDGRGDPLGLHLVTAAREVLEYEDMRRWLNGTC